MGGGQRWGSGGAHPTSGGYGGGGGSVDVFDELVEVVRRLRGEGGCPWDRAQTPASMRPYVLEEAYEVVEAIDRGDTAELRKELGDLLFQVVLLARMAEDEGRFDLPEVVAAITEKMVVRHPHVFDPDHVAERDEGAVSAWEARKAKERTGSALDGVPDALPALLRAHRISEKAGAVGFDWPDLPSVREKVGEELAELDEAVASGDEEAIAEELGDLLFAVVNLGRHLPVTAEDALRRATRKFEVRFREVEARVASEGRTVHDVPLDELEAHWQAAKAVRR
ncbi:MAG: nucleoside triphosphate pyrophosphohydrolase [Alphaproteobacteria bacterium]|nr:nucleoside triphosphate pyrophosphohydrolase [Alphaproteobacteria bacterium]